MSNDAVSLARLYADTRTSIALQGVNVEGMGLVSLNMRNIEVFAPGARLVVSDGRTEQVLQRPKTRFMRGTINGNSSTIVALSVTPDGTVTGLMTEGMRKWEIRRSPSTNTLEAVAPLPANAQSPDQGFTCGNDRLVEPPQMEQVRQSTAPRSTGVPRGLPAGQLYKATIAIETDFEFFQKMGSNSTTANNYIGNLFNYISAIYENDSQTRLTVGDVFLWTTSSDPWVEMGGTWCRLAEFGRYWKNNRSGVTRTLAHFLSGANLGGGIAWLDTMCMAPQTSSGSNTGCASVPEYVYGGFGVSANISGVISTSAGPAWDATVVAHEMGHNFSSPHTHCYGGIGGNSSPVDGCYAGESGSGCHTGTTGLPGIGSLLGGTSNTRNGTIMSYCHLLSGNQGNIAASFGKNHIYGVAANRVSDRMSTRVAQVAAANPSCIPVISTTNSTAQFSAANYSVAENVAGGNVTIQVTRSDTTGTASVNYATSNGSATAPGDYTARSGTLNFAAGAATASFQVPIIDDTAVESSETINLTLSSPVNLTIGTQGTAVITITDNDTAPAGTVQFATASTTVNESAGTATVSVTRSSTVGNVSVNYTTVAATAKAGTDYTHVAGTLNFAAGAATASIVVPIVNDSVAELKESFRITLSNPVGATLGTRISTTVLIADDDPSGAVIEFETAGYAVTEGTASIVLKVKRSTAAGVASVSYTTVAGTATAGGDYQTRTGTLSFAAGISVMNISVPIINGTIQEGVETFTVVLSSPVGGTLGTVKTATVTITDND